MKRLLFIVYVVLCAQFILAQTTEGTEFWLTFMNNENTPEGDEGLVLKLIASSRQDATITVSNPQTGYTDAFDVKANSVAEFIVPHEQGYTFDIIAKTKRGLRITATAPVSLYASNFQEHTYDATIVLPVTALGTDYIAQMYESNYGAKEIAVVATQDNTTITIIPHARTMNGLSPGDTFTFTLNVGETYLLMSSYENGTFSGTRVQSNHPVAVFAGHQCINIPADNKACDHIVEQQMPTQMWGKQFALTKTKGQKGDMVVVTARDDNTDVKINGTKVTTLQALQSYEFRLTDNSAFVETSGPAACYLYLEGAERNNYIGDPSSVHVSPVEQHVKQITFATFQTSISRTHYVNVVTTAAGAESMTLDGKNISGEFAVLTGNGKFRFAQISIAHGTHTLRTNADGFMGHVYGLGDCESYAYTMGSAIRQLDGLILVDGEPRSNMLYDETRCYKVPVTFSPHANADFNTIEWDFGDGQKSAQSTVSHTYDSPGTYHVEMRIANEDGKDTARTVLTLIETLRDTVYATICDGDKYSLAGQTFTTEGKHEVNLTSAGGCDSIVTLYLTVGKKYEINETASFRKGSSYHWHSRWFREGGVYRDTLRTVYGCDSVFVLTLTEEEATVEMADTICWQPTYSFRGYEYTLPPIDDYKDREYVDYVLEYFDKEECEHYIIDLAIVPKESGSYELWAEIQGGETYDFFGDILSTPGVYTKTVESACNCVQEYTLYLSVHSFPIDKSTAALCHEDSYTFGDKLYTEPGVYRDTVMSETGIDAIRELTLSDNRTSYEMSIDNVSSYNFNGQVLTEAGTYYDTLVNALGCDSVVTLYFMPRIVIETEVQVGDMCTDAGMLEVYFFKFEPVQHVRFRFDDMGHAAGLRDTVMPMTTDGVLSLPIEAHPGIYDMDMDLIVHESVMGTLHAQITILYPSSVLEQAWNDVVAVLTHDYNGGYDFVAFQWFENGMLLDGETASYLYRPLIIGGEYSALLTEQDGTQMMTCPLVATEQVEISLYPTVAEPRQQIHCFVSQPAELTVYDTMGRTVSQTRLQQGDNLIASPEVTGIYTVRVINSADNAARTYKLIIR